MSLADRRARASIAGLPILTQVAGKLDWYAFDPYFRDACEDAATLGAAGRPPDLRRHAFIVFRPDAVLTRSIGAGLEVLTSAGFEVLDAVEFTYSHLHVREGWRYQLNIATRDRIEAMDLIMGATPSLFCLVRGPTSGGQPPASALLAGLKGPSAPEARRPGQIRAEMGPVQASVLTFVHTPDEPADLLRELAVFLPPAARQRALDLLARQRPAWPSARLEEAVAALYARTPAHSLEAEPVLDRLRTGANPAGRRLLDQIAAGRSCSMRPTLEALRRLDAGFSDLDAIAICARIGEQHIGGADPVIPDVDPALWVGS
jgi:hypothetical protein